MIQGISKVALFSSSIYGLGDSITTYLNYNRPGVMELNPIMNYLIASGWFYFFAFKLLLIFFFTACISYLYYKGTKRLAKIGIGFILLLGLFIIINNLLLI